jgi:hypothetical protein
MEHGSPTEKQMRLPKFDPEKLGLVIGPSNAACEKNSRLRKLPSLRKNVITPCWKSFNHHKEKNPSEETDPKTPYIELKTDGDGVYAVVTSDSEVMMKFAMFHLDKYHTTFEPPKNKMYYNMYAALNHNDIPRLIGRQASTIKSLRSDAVSQMDDSVETDDLDFLDKSFVKVEKCIPRDTSDFVQMVNGNEKATFVGWPPEDGEEIVKISVSSLASKESFDQFIEFLTDIMTEQIRKMNEKTASFKHRKDQEIVDMEEALNGDW